MKPLAYALAAIGAFLLYESLRERVASATRTVVPPIFREQFAGRDPSLGLAAPVLGTDYVSRVVGRVAEQAILDSLPTLIGRKRADPE